jgi:hypothetical protein
MQDSQPLSDLPGHTLRFLKNNKELFFNGQLDEDRTKLRRGETVKVTSVPHASVPGTCILALEHRHLHEIFCTCDIHNVAEFKKQLGEYLEIID